MTTETETGCCARAAACVSGARDPIRSGAMDDTAKTNPPWHLMAERARVTHKTAGWTNSELSHRPDAEPSACRSIIPSESAGGQAGKAGRCPVMEARAPQAGRLNGQRNASRAE